MNAKATPTRRRQEERRDLTRAALIKAARELFAEKGFANAGTDEIIQRAGVSRGALYHHFREKADLFRAVFEQAEAELSERVVAAASRAHDPIRQLYLGIDAFLDFCLEPHVQRIVILEAPTVLGWETWQEIDSHYAFGLIAAGLEGAMKADALERQPVEPLTHLLLGALTQAAMAIARADDPQAARKRMGKSLRRLIDGLQTAAP